MTEQQAWTLGLGLGIGLLLLWLCLHLRGRERLLRDMPTSKAKGVFIGLVEMKGQARCEEPLFAYLSASEVVYFSYDISEHWSRTVTETYTDSNGKSQTRTRHESGWKTIASGGDMTPFYVQDDTGAVLVRPEGARIDAVQLFSEECSPGDALYYGKGPEGCVPDSDHRRRFVEHGIPLGADLYVVGQAREREDIVAPEIAQDREAPLFLISTKSEEKVRGGYAIGSWFAWLGALLGGAVAGFSFHPFLGRWFMPEQAQIWAAVGGLVLMLFLWGLCWIWMAFNSLVSLRQRVRQAWSLIDVQLKRRHDLIPRLVEVLKAQKGHEQTLQTSLASLRTQAQATAPGEVGPDPEGLVPVMRAVLEAYPELGAQEGFARLHDELVETEQRIALARGYYNDIATQLATRLEQLPDRWVGSLVSMKPEPLLGAEGFERASVGIKF